MITSTSNITAYASSMRMAFNQEQQTGYDVTASQQKETQTAATEAAEQAPASLLSALGRFDMSNTDELKQEFSDKITALLKKNGISTDEPFDLGVGTDGSVYVKGDNPQKEEIEAIFSDDPDLSNLYRHITANEEIMAAGQNHINFSEAYAINPQRALMQYSYLFDGSTHYDVTATIGNEGIDWNTKMLRSLA